jgi:hypothetical protein
VPRNLVGNMSAKIFQSIVNHVTEYKFVSSRGQQLCGLNSKPI